MYVPMRSALKLQLLVSKRGCWLYNFRQNRVQDSVSSVTVIFVINDIKMRTEKSNFT